jgi:hypothetical protein
VAPSLSEVISVKKVQPESLVKLVAKACSKSLEPLPLRSHPGFGNRSQLRPDEQRPVLCTEFSEQGHDGSQ